VGEGDKTIQRRVLDALVEVFGMQYDWLLGRRGTSRVTKVRAIGYYVLRKYTDLSTREIGDVFGGRDHSTVIKGTDRIAWELKHDIELVTQIDQVLLVAGITNMPCGEFVLSYVVGKPVDFLDPADRQAHQCCARANCHMPRGQHGIVVSALSVAA
jgi:hypothetical protein